MQCDDCGEYVEDGESVCPECDSESVWATTEDGCCKCGRPTFAVDGQQCEICSAVQLRGEPHKCDLLRPVERTVAGINMLEVAARVLTVVGRVRKIDAVRAAGDGATTPGLDAMEQEAINDLRPTWELACLFMDEEGKDLLAELALLLPAEVMPHLQEFTARLSDTVSTPD
jgi:hypothetical protein